MPLLKGCQPGLRWATGVLYSSSTEELMDGRMAAKTGFYSYLPLMRALRMPSLACWVRTARPRIAPYGGRIRKGKKWGLIWTGLRGWACVGSEVFLGKGKESLRVEKKGGRSSGEYSHPGRGISLCQRPVMEGPVTWVVHVAHGRSTVGPWQVNSWKGCGDRRKWSWRGADNPGDVGRVHSPRSRLDQ